MYGFDGGVVCLRLRATDNQNVDLALVIVVGVRRLLSGVHGLDLFESVAHLRVHGVHDRPLYRCGGLALRDRCRSPYDWTTFTRRPSRSNSTTPSAMANSVSSLARRTLR